MVKMSKIWVCESCSDRDLNNTGNASQTFSTQEQLIQHITHHHLSKKIEHGRTVFVCTYEISFTYITVKLCPNTIFVPLPNIDMALRVFVAL